MARPSDNVKREIVPAWALFAGEALAIGKVSQAAAKAAGQPGLVDDGGYYADTPDAVFLRSVANAKKVRPEPDTVWQAGEAARSVRFIARDGSQVKYEWCSGLLFLFAASYFQAFANALLSADPEILTPKRRRHLLDDITDAVRPTMPEGWADIQADLLARNQPETVVRATLRRLQRDGQAAVARPERKTWELTPREVSALQTAWLRPSQTSTVPVVTASLADLHPEIGLDAQRQVVLTALQAATRS